MSTAIQSVVYFKAYMSTGMHAWVKNSNSYFMGVERQAYTRDSGIDSGTKQVVSTSQKLRSAEFANERRKIPGSIQSLWSQGLS